MTVDAGICAASPSVFSLLTAHNLDTSNFVTSAIFAVLTVVLLHLFGAYRTILSHMEVGTILDVSKALVLATAATAALTYTFRSQTSRADLILIGFLAFGGLTIFRLLARRTIRNAAKKRQTRKNVAIYGAGAAGLQVAAALQRSLEYNAAVYLDDNTSLHGRVLQSLPVLSPLKLQSVVTDYSLDEIVLAIPSADPKRRQEIIRSLQDLPVRIRSVPSVSDILIKGATLDQIDEVGVEDLLQRAPVFSERDDVAEEIKGKNVLVSGAGGSIGSEICRQLLRCGPAQMILLDIAEPSLYEIDQSLRALNTSDKAAKIIPILGSVCSPELIRQILSTYKIQKVYHAAAYKHVPLVEANPFEALLNNTFGTLNLATEALRHGVESFVLISTDKAVRPTNVMGATKRLAEQVIQSLSQDVGATSEGRQPTATRFCMVRFGNVLDSSGSVVPLFRRQIRRGGPVTVTHPDVTRYFMTIPEAVDLVLQASVFAASGDLFVLDMGQPVKILDLAEKIIRLSGFTIKDKQHPDGDIAIEFIGLRPGEKLHEELLIGSDVSPTRHPKIMRAREGFLVKDQLDIALSELNAAIEKRDLKETLELVRKVVPEYQKFAG